ncbi:hypothetical protein DFJ58DRAFT_718054 [Suillus subalutaceus]|uniref:uncharacterized protein n=1 Tax=Suillus subalutaceus TaxID=48586 RepID=UPI001B860D27|nr:uncharacterized protein DFJ58DRAFT_718054 [Suillus subalutaceus]KAG1842004.1 hypothetical protein DFJ58DRAFT_718054 [Suillus subalutaceus]
MPIRSNPTPTRSSTTLITAVRYLLSRLRSRLPDAQTLHDACFGEARRFAREVLAPSEVGRLKDPETEELEFVTDPTEKTRIQGDLIILNRIAPLEHPENAPCVPPAFPALPADTLLAQYIFSQALSRSTSLSGLEESLKDYLSSPCLSRVALIKKLRALMKFRQGLNLNGENFSDTPDLYWTEPGFRRTNAVNEKITYAAEVQSTLRQLLTEVLIALIAVEVVIALIRDGPELWQMVFG